MNVSNFSGTRFSVVSVYNLYCWYCWKKNRKFLDNDSFNGTELPALSKSFDSLDHNIYRLQNYTHTMSIMGLLGF